MKTLLKTNLIAAAMVLLLAGCSKDEPQNNTLPTAPHVSITVISVSEDSATIGFDVTNGISYNCAAGQESDLAAFAKGTLEGIKSQIPVSQKEVTFDNLKPATEYTVFVQVNTAEATGGVKTDKFTTAEPSNPDLQVSITSANVGEDFISFVVSYGADTKSLDYAIGQPEDKTAFENGTLGTTKNIAVPLSTSLEFGDLESGKEYTVFVRANSNSAHGETASIQRRTVLLQLDIDVKILDDGSANITFTPGGDTESFVFVLDIPGEMENVANWFGSGLINEVFVYDMSQPYTHPFERTEEQSFMPYWCIYYQINSALATSPIRTYNFSFD